MSERYYSGVAEVREVYSAEEANKLLGEGWELLGVKTVTVYVMGLQAPRQEKKLDPAELDRLPWTLYKGAKVAGWIFSDPRAQQNRGFERLVSALREEIERRGGEARIGRFTYSFSGPQDNPRMFIRREIEGERKKGVEG